MNENWQDNMTLGVCFAAPNENVWVGHRIVSETDEAYAVRQIDEKDREPIPVLEERARNLSRIEEDYQNAMAALNWKVGCALIFTLLIVLSHVATY